LTFADSVLDDPSIIGLTQPGRNSHIVASYPGGADRGPFRMRVNYNRLRLDVLFGDEPTIAVDGKVTTHDLLAELSDLATVEILASDVLDTPIDFLDPDRPVFTLTATDLSRHYFGSVQFVGTAVTPPVETGRRHLVAFHEESFVTSDFTTALEASARNLVKTDPEAPYNGAVVTGSGVNGEYAALQYFEDDEIYRNIPVVRLMSADGSQVRHLLLSDMQGEYGPSSYEPEAIWPGVQFEQFDNRVGSMSVKGGLTNQAVWHKGYLYLVVTMDATRQQDVRYNAVVRVRHDVTPAVVEPVLTFPDIESIHSDGTHLIANSSVYDQAEDRYVYTMHVATDGSDWVRHTPALEEAPPFAYGDAPLTMLSVGVDDNGVDVEIAFANIDQTEGLQQANVPNFVGPTADLLDYLQNLHNVTTTVEEGSLSFNYARALLDADGAGVLVLHYYYSKYDQDTQNWTEIPLTVFNVRDSGIWATTYILDSRAGYADYDMPIYRSGDNILVAGSDFGNVGGDSNNLLELGFISTDAGNGWSVWSPPAQFSELMETQGYDPGIWLPMAITPMYDPPTETVGPETVLPEAPSIGEPRALSIDKPVIFRAEDRVWIANSQNYGGSVFDNAASSTSLPLAYFNAVQADGNGFISTAKGLGDLGTSSDIFLAGDTRYQYDPTAGKLEKLTEAGHRDMTFIPPTWSQGGYTTPVKHVNQHSNGSVIISCFESWPLLGSPTRLQLYFCDEDGSNLRSVDYSGVALPADLNENGDPAAYRFVRTVELNNGEVLGWALSEANNDYITKTYLCRISATGVLLQMVQVVGHLENYNSDPIYLIEDTGDWHVSNDHVYFAVYDSYTNQDDWSTVETNFLRRYDLTTLSLDAGFELNLMDYGPENKRLTPKAIINNTGLLYFVEVVDRSQALYHLEMQGSSASIVRTADVPVLAAGASESIDALRSLFRDPVDGSLWVAGGFGRVVESSDGGGYPLEAFGTIQFDRQRVVRLGGTSNEARPEEFEVGVCSPWFNAKEAVRHDRYNQIGTGVLYNLGDDSQIDYGWNSVYQYGSLELEADGTVDYLATATSTSDKISALMIRLSAISPSAPLLAFDIDTHTIDDSYPDTVNGLAKVTLTYEGVDVVVGLGISVDGGNNESFCYRFDDGPIAGRLEAPSSNSQGLKREGRKFSHAVFQISDRQIGELFGVSPGVTMSGIEGWVEWNGKRVGIRFDMSHAAAPEELPFYMASATDARLTGNFSTFRMVSDPTNAPLSVTYGTSPVGTMPNRTIYTTTVEGIEKNVRLHWSTDKGESWSVQPIEGAYGTKYDGISPAGVYFKGGYYTRLQLSPQGRPDGNQIPINALVRISREDESVPPVVEEVLSTRHYQVNNVATDGQTLVVYDNPQLHTSTNGKDWSTRKLLLDSNSPSSTFGVDAMVVANNVVYGLRGTSQGLSIVTKDLSDSDGQWVQLNHTAADTGVSGAVTDAYVLDSDTILFGGKGPSGTVAGTIWRYTISTNTIETVEADSWVRAGRFLDNGRTLVYSGFSVETGRTVRRGAFTNDRTGGNWQRMTAHTEITACTNLIPVQGTEDTLPLVEEIPVPASINRISANFLPAYHVTASGATQGMYRNPTTGKSVVWGGFINHTIDMVSPAIAGRYLIVLNADGTVDTNWSSPYNASTLNSGNRIINCILEDDDAVIVVHGQSFNNGTHTAVVHRYSADGTPDAAFAAMIASVTGTISNIHKVTSGHLYLTGAITAVGGQPAGRVVRIDPVTWEHDVNWVLDPSIPAKQIIANSDESLLLITSDAIATVVTTSRVEGQGHQWYGSDGLELTNTAGVVRTGRLFAPPLGSPITNVPVVYSLLKHGSKIWVAGLDLFVNPSDESTRCAVLELDDQFEVVGNPLAGKLVVDMPLGRGKPLVYGATDNGSLVILSHTIRTPEGEIFNTSEVMLPDGSYAGDNIAALDSDGTLRTFFMGYESGQSTAYPSVSSMVAAGGDKLMVMGGYAGVVLSYFPRSYAQRIWYASLLDVGTQP